MKKINASLLAGLVQVLVLEDGLPPSLGFRRTFATTGRRGDEVRPLPQPSGSEHSGGSIRWVAAAASPNRRIRYHVRSNALVSAGKSYELVIVKTVASLSEHQLLNRLKGAEVYVTLNNILNSLM